MMLRKLFFVFLVVVFGVAVNGYSMSVSKIVCGLGVKDRKIIKPSDEFKNAKRVYCLVELRNIKKPTFIITRWILGERHFDVKLKVKPYRRFRTWSYKTIYPSMKGVWKFDVLNSNGKLLGERIFVVK